jgi:hypothetical protein
MRNFNLERLKFRWQGNWTTNFQYRKDDIIYYEGKAYVCLKSHTSSLNFYNEKQSDYIEETVTVTVEEDSINEQAQGKLYLNGVESPEFFLLKGRTYTFDQSDISNVNFNNSENIILFSNVDDGTQSGGTDWTTGIEYFLNGEAVTKDNYILGFAESATRFLKFTVPETVPDRIYYYSFNNPDLGGRVDTRYSSYWELMSDGYEWKGDWTTETFYSLGNIVKFKGYLYRALAQHTSTNLVNIGLPADSENWILYAASYNWLDEWLPQSYYDLGDVVRYNGRTFICTESHQAADNFDLGLENDNSNWKIVSRSDNWRSEWTPSTRYIIDDLVKYGAIIYRSVQEHTSSDNFSTGLESDSANWQEVHVGIEFKGEWTDNFRYKKNDIVRYGPTLYKAILGHQSISFIEDEESNWSVYVPGLSYENTWSDETQYARGEIVRYGGYTYTALQNNFNSVPSINGKAQNTGDWELLTEGYNLKGEWQETIFYRTGDVVQRGGYLYVAISDSTAVFPDEDNETWEILNKSQKFRAEWQDNQDYILGDIVTFRGTAYICILRHNAVSSDSRPDLDQLVGPTQYWAVLIKGSENNRLENIGDIKAYDSEVEKLAIGNTGQVLAVNDNNTSWRLYGSTDNVYYVSPDGEDSENYGNTRADAFRTIKFACDFILQNEAERAPATIYISTGLYEEILPISVPANVALVGDELRSTTVTPAEGFETSNMFLVRNGSGIRNMSFRGLKGELGPLNEFLTRRPSAGAYVSLDPGEGPDDESVWISTKSCYVQNVSTFGTGCIGMRIDGALHNGGNRSIVANDFTQVLSDGIGYWASDNGRSELVSVFTYYCHIGYLATNGGILRATNGNNSYGEFGSVAEGFNENETPITATIDNTRNEAQVDEIITFGTNEQKIIALGYLHAGETYTQASIEFSGAGTGASGTYEEIRNGAISRIRVLGPEDSSLPGGNQYTNTINNAQAGNATSIRISQADSRESADYIGQRIRIVSGRGVGQYAEISAFDPETKDIIVSREYDGENGWDNFQPGWPIEDTLDETTRYSIEPKIDIAEPAFQATSTLSPSTSEPWHYIIYGDQWIAVTKSATETRFSTSRSGSSWSTPGTVADKAATGIVYSNGLYVIAFSAESDGSATESIATSANGSSWTTSSIGFTDRWNDIAADDADNVIIVGENLNVRSVDNGATWSNDSLLPQNERQWQLAEYGNGKFVAIDNEVGDVAVSTDAGTEWTIYPNAVPNYNWTDITYGNGRFVVIAPPSDSTEQVTRVAISFDGISWQENFIEIGDYEYVSYGAGVFIATGPGLSAAKSQSGIYWKTVQDDSSQYLLTDSSTWKNAAYNTGKWIVVNDDGTNWNTITTGARPIIRTSMRGSSIDEFIIYDPGSNYSETPEVVIQDNGVQIEALYTVKLSNGVLPQPEMKNRGAGYTSAFAEISGDGFAELFQVGKDINLSNLSAIPGPGANVAIDGITDVRYNLVSVSNVIETGDTFDVTASIDPPIDVLESPSTGTNLILREEYSQIRLTGHDFLDIGTGNFEQTNYPELYVEGETSENAAQPFNETRARGGGRVFYTSTDQDGNFNVGSLFKVEQASGIVTINASQFDLSGLTELALGGIQVGGTQVIIREFSRDPTFLANSNFIVPTQAAIGEYILRQVSGGGSNAQTNRLVAGQIEIQGNSIDTTSDLSINVNSPIQVKGGVGGHYLALQFFSTAGGFGLE